MMSVKRSAEPADQQRIQGMYNLQVIGEAPNEVYQFSELEHRIFNEKLIKITLKDEQPSIEEKTADEMTDEVVDVVTEVTSEVGTKGAAEDQVEESSEEYAETSKERADEDEQ